MQANTLAELLKLSLAVLSDPIEQDRLTRQINALEDQELIAALALLAVLLLKDSLLRGVNLQTMGKPVWTPHRADGSPIDLWGRYRNGQADEDHSA